MPIEIRDGTGNGYAAKVSGRNRLAIAAIVESGEAAASVVGDAYMINTSTTARTLTLTATGGAMLYLENDDAERVLVVSAVFTSTTSTAGVAVTFYRNSTLGTVADNNAFTPVNLNFNSGQTPTTVAHSWDEVNNGIGGLTLGTIVHAQIIGQGLTLFPFDEAFSLRKDDNLVVHADPLTAETPEFAAAIRFHMVDADVFNELA